MNHKINSFSLSCEDGRKWLSYIYIYTRQSINELKNNKVKTQDNES